MPIKDLYKNKYLKYKKKYLNLQNQIGGGLQIYTSCYIYNVTVIIVRLIMLLLYKDYNFDMDRDCKYYYDVDKHNFTYNIFEKLEEIFNFKSTCDGEVLTGFESLSEEKKKILKKRDDIWLKELNTSLLFHFIYIILEEKLNWKCEDGDILSGCYYILDYFKTTNITIDIFKEKINYRDLNAALQTFFESYIVNFVKIFNNLYILLNSNSKPIFYVYTQNIEDKEYYFDIIKSINEDYTTNITNIERPDISKNNHFAMILIYILYQGFYALFQIDYHVIIITGCTGFTGFTDFTDFKMDFTNIFLNVENTLYCEGTNHKWCKLIKNNKIKLIDIINIINDRDDTLYVLFLYPTQINNDFIINNKNIDENNLTNENVKKELTNLNVYSENIDLLINLTITDSTFDDNDIKILKILLKKILKKLNLSNNRFTDKQVALLLEGLLNNITLSELTLNYNQIHDKSIVLLQKYIENRFIKLRTLNLESSFKDAIQLTGDTALTDATQLTAATIPTAATQLTDATIPTAATIPTKIYRMEIIKLAHALSTNMTLTEVNIRDNKITDFETIALAYALKTPLNIIKFFNLSDNMIGNIGAKAIAETLNKLKLINLSHNLIGDEGATSIATAMKKNTTLKYIYLNHNQIGDDGAIQLIKALDRSTTLKIFNIKDNQISSDKYKKLTDVLDRKNIKYPDS